MPAQTKETTPKQIEPVREEAATIPEETEQKSEVKIEEMDVPGQKTSVEEAEAASLTEETAGKETTKAVPNVPLNAPLEVESAKEDRFEELPPIEKKNKKIFIIGLFIAVVIITSTLSLGYLFLTNQSSKSNVVPEVVEEEKEPTPTPVKLVREDWTIEVLNGSGIAGAAKKMADKFEELGYTVVKTGNADNKDYETTEVFISSEEKSEGEAKLFLEDLDKEFGISDSSGNLSDSTASARIIIGSE